MLLASCGSGLRGSNNRGGLLANSRTICSRISEKRMKFITTLLLLLLSHTASGLKLRVIPQLANNNNVCSAEDRNFFLGGNWKNFLSYSDMIVLTKSLSLENFPIENTDIVVFPSPIHLLKTKEELSQSKIQVGAQSISSYEGNGAYTGEITAFDLHSISVQWGETEDDFLRQMRYAIKYKMNVVYCIGETIEEYEEKRTKATLEKQLKNVIMSTAEASLLEPEGISIVIAYEPRWAIGSGKSASTKDIEDTHQFIRNVLAKEVLNHCRIRIIYGGSVSNKNSESIKAVNNVDGFLIGKFSLNSKDFLSILKP